MYCKNIVIVNIMIYYNILNMNLEHYINSWILVDIILSFNVAIKAFGFEQRSSYLLPELWNIYYKK